MEVGTLETMRRRRNVCLSLAAIGALVVWTGCAHRYSEDRDDWVGPRDADFDPDFGACRERMDEARFRYGGDPRLLFLECMEKRDWHLKGRS